jgi:hypothetical protein
VAIIKRIVCLANSRKLLGRCIAGREVSRGRLGAWIRPVSDRETEEVSAEERCYVDGTEPAVLDVIDVPLLHPRPRGHQTENWVIQTGSRWTKVGKLSWHHLEALADHEGPLWINCDSTYHGLWDRVPLDQLAGIRSSLKLIRVKHAQLRVHRPSSNFGDLSRRVQVRFEFGGVLYALRVTDPVIEQYYLSGDDGIYSLGDSYLTVSLGEPYRGHCYKLVAAVIRRPD